MSGQAVETGHIGGVAGEVAQFNAHVPIGTPVAYWPGTREGAGRESVTRSRAWLLGDHTPVVMVEGYGGGIALTHVLPLRVDACDERHDPDLPCGSCGATPTYRITLRSKPVPACLRHYNVWRTPAPDYTCPTACLERNHPGQEHSDWLTTPPGQAQP